MLTSLSKRLFWWPALAQTIFGGFDIKSVEIIVNCRKVLWIHAGHQTHVLKRLFSVEHAEPRAQMLCKNHETKILLHGCIGKLREAQSSSGLLMEAWGSSGKLRDGQGCIGKLM